MYQQQTGLVGQHEHPVQKGPETLPSPEENKGPLVCVGHYYRASLILWLHHQLSLQWPAGGTTDRAKKKLEKTYQLSWAVLWTLWRMLTKTSCIQNNPSNTTYETVGTPRVAPSAFILIFFYIVFISFYHVYATLVVAALFPQEISPILS